MKYRKKLVLFLLGLLLSTFLTAPVSAAGETGSLTLHYVLNDCTFRLYNVADYNSDGSFRVRADYKKLPIDWSDLENENWYELANNLDTMVIAKKISADRTAATDQNGKVVFDGLPYGLWLIAGGSKTQGADTYTTQPLLVAIPGTEKDGTVHAARELTISKYSKQTKPDRISVMKVWEDNRNAARPKSIRVTLYRDELSYETVTLNAENNWRYAWDALESGHIWRIAENDVPDGYTVSYSREGNALYITNTKPTTPPSPPRIPQTGVNWTPVFVLLSLSLVCLIIGVWRRKQDEEQS